MASTDTTFDTDCVLMLHMDGANTSTTFTDSSTSGKTITANGNAQISTAQSQFGGASGLFDGTGDYLTGVDSADWDWSADFTCDFWVRRAIASNGVFFEIGNGFTAAGKGVGMYFTDTKQLQCFVNGTQVITANLTFSETTWYHFALVRSGSTLTLYQAGVSVGSGTTSADTTGSTQGIIIGRGTSAAYTALDLNGNLDEFRLVKGTAVWTSNFTPPTAAYTQAVVGGNISDDTFAMCA